jgi:hypothetical protein
MKQNRTNQPGKKKKKNRKIIAVRNDEVLPLLRQQTNKQTRSIITPPQNLSLLLLGLVQSVPTKHSFFSTCAPHTHPTLSEGRERERDREREKTKRADEENLTYTARNKYLHRYKYIHTTAQFHVSNQPIVTVLFLPPANIKLRRNNTNPKGQL